MSEELLQRGLDKTPEKIGKWDFYSIGATTIKALKEYGILHNIDYGASERKKVDALIVLHKNVIAVIEYKKPSEFKTKAQKEKAIEQEIEVAQKLKAKVFIATDTKESVWVNTLTGNKIKDENGNEIKILFDFTKVLCIRTNINYILDVIQSEHRTLISIAGSVNIVVFQTRFFGTSSCNNLNLVLLVL